MKKLLKTILIIAIIGGVMLFTCPEEEKHVDKVTKELVRQAQNEVGANADDSDIVEDILGDLIGGAVSEKLVHLYVENQLVVDDYAVLNVGKMNYEGEERVVSIGAFNHVFSLMKLNN